MMMRRFYYFFANASFYIFRPVIDLIYQVDFRWNADGAGVYGFGSLMPSIVHYIYSCNQLGVLKRTIWR